MNTQKTIQEERFTAKEKAVLKVIADYCYDDCFCTFEDIADETCLSINTVKGVVGSLVKKNVVVTDEDDCSGEVTSFINLWLNDDCVSFGCDQFGKDEYKKLVADNFGVAL